MGAVRGATSLVELILRKWGDDVEGAAKELEEKVGFPESVANRIATGELPMDEASRLKRAQEQGYGDELYHGSTHDITEFNGQGNPSNDWGQGTYLTDSIYDASTNYAGEGPDLTIRLETTAERIADDLQSSWSHASEFWDHLPGGGGGKLADEIDALAEAGKYEEAAMMAARAITKGGNEGVIYPVRVKQEGLLNVTDEVELPDYNAQAADELGYDYDKYVNEEYDEDVLYEIEERGYELEADDYDSPNAAMFGVANDLGADMRHVESIYEGDTWNDVRNKLGEASVETDEGDYIGAGGILSDVMERTGATGVVDGHAPSRFPTMGAGEHTIIFPGNENQIRSVNAAYDPQYTGSNMMGNATLPMLGLTGTAAAAGSLLMPNDAEAGVSSVFRHGADAARKFANRVPGDNKAPNPKPPGRTRSGLGTQEAADKLATDLDEAIKNGATQKDLELLVGNYVHGDFDYNDWVKSMGRVDGGKDGAAYLTGTEIMNEELKELLPERHHGIIDSYTKFRLGPNEQGRPWTQAAGLESRNGEGFGDQELYNSLFDSSPTPAVPANPSNSAMADALRQAGVKTGVDRSNLKKGLLPAGAAAGGSGAANSAVPTSPEERGFKSWEEVSRDPTAPLPPPTWGETFEKVGDNLGMILDAPMKGWQGIVRGLYGLANGEDLVTAGAQANSLMEAGVEEGAQRAGDWVAEKTGDDTLGFYTKYGLLFGAPF